MKRKRSILLWLIIGFFSFSIYKLVLVDRLGFCASKLWVTSSNELILKQIDALMKSGMMKLDPADSSPKAYLGRHTTCCSAVWGREQPFDRGLTCFGSATITVTYELSEKGKQFYGASGKDKYYESLTDYTACGKVVGYTGSTE